jgi:hypothetical protein
MTRPLLASSAVDGDKIVLAPIVPTSRNDADYFHQRAVERAALFAQILRPPPRSRPVLVHDQRSGATQ